MADYTVVARRYRPRQFADLVGQEPVARALTNALQGDRVAHAYLFTGLRGVGKTSAARILAKALNCVRGPTATPCDQCEICLSIASGEDVDVLEIDAASNTGVDNIRDIRNNVHFRPTRARYKIYIIDEVHMLSKGAFNALLKTLEEPPANVKFILATTELNKIPATILSRCQRFDFAGIATDRIVKQLDAIVTAEGMRAETEALELVARRAGGSMRDAQSLLDQLLAFGDRQLTAEAVHRLLGTASDDFVVMMGQHLIARDAPAALEHLRAGVQNGVQVGELLDGLVELWRDLMLVGCAGVGVSGLSLAKRFHPTLAEFSKRITLDAVLAGLDILSSTKTRLRNSNHGRTLVEMTLIRLARLDDLQPLAQLAQVLADGVTAAAPAAGSTPGAKATIPTRPVAPPEAAKKKADEPKADAVPPTIQAAWAEIVVQVGPMHGHHLQVAGAPAIAGPNCMVLRYPAGYNHEYEFCSRPDRIEKVQDGLKRITGTPWQLRVERVSSPADAKAPTPVVTAPQPRTVLNDPLLQRAIDVLGAKAMTVEDGFGSVPQPAGREEP